MLLVKSAEKLWPLVIFFCHVRVDMGILGFEFFLVPRVWWRYFIFCDFFCAPSMVAVFLYFIDFFGLLPGTGYQRLTKVGFIFCDFFGACGFNKPRCVLYFVM